MATDEKPTEEPVKGDERILPPPEPLSAEPTTKPIAPLELPSPQSELPTPPAPTQPTAELNTVSESRPNDVKTEKLSAFERSTVLIGWLGLGMGFLSFLAASVAGFFVYHQWQEMNAQTGFMNRASIQARKDSADSSVTTAKQIGILERQLTEQADALRMDQRPWVKIELGGPHPEGVDSDNAKVRILPLAIGQPLKIPVRLTNIGKTTAQRLSFALVIQLLPNAKNALFPKKGHLRFIEDDQAIPRQGVFFPGGGWEEATLYPQEVSEFSLSRMRNVRGGKREDDPLTQEEKSAIDRGSSYILLLGEVWYSDIFGASHWTKFCEMSNTQLNTLVGKKCARFSSVDGN